MHYETSDMYKSHGSRRRGRREAQEVNGVGSGGVRVRIDARAPHVADLYEEELHVRVKQRIQTPRTWLAFLDAHSRSH
jgi:hypothetical protein